MEEATSPALSMWLHLVLRQFMRQHKLGTSSRVMTSFWGLLLI